MSKKTITVFIILSFLYVSSSSADDLCGLDPKSQSLKSWEVYKKIGRKWNECLKSKPKDEAKKIIDKVIEKAKSSGVI